MNLKQLRAIRSYENALRGMKEQPVYGRVVQGGPNPVVQFTGGGQAQVKSREIVSGSQNTGKTAILSRTSGRLEILGIR